MVLPIAKQYKQVLLCRGLNMGNPCDYRASWTHCYCITGLIITIPLYFLALILSWSFAKGIPLEVHDHSPSNTNFSLGAAVALTLPAVVFIAALCILLACDNEECGDMGFKCAAFSWGCACCCSGAFSVIGAYFLFSAAAAPPAPELQGYIAFAAITGIVASIAVIAYCCMICGYGVKRYDGTNCVWQLQRDDSLL